MPHAPAWRARPHAPASGSYLCEAAQVPADNGLEVVFGAGSPAPAGVPFRVVVFRVEDGLRAYVNECPHAGVPYSFVEDTFCVYDIEGRRDLLCPHHSALFHLDDGACYDGPCAGERLIPVDIAIDDAGQVRIA